MRKFRAVFIAAFLLSFTRAEVNPAVVDGMNQYIAGGYFANEYLLLNPLGREEEQAWDRLLRKENLTLMMEDHEWLSDFINLELREKFFRYSQQIFNDYN
jgi:hypothetical protein